jgi:hypothetical protein
MTNNIALYAINMPVVAAAKELQFHPTGKSVSPNKWGNNYTIAKM